MRLEFENPLGYIVCEITEYSRTEEAIIVFRNRTNEIRSLSAHLINLHMALSQSSSGWPKCRIRGESRRSMIFRRLERHSGDRDYFGRESIASLSGRNYHSTIPRTYYSLGRLAIISSYASNKVSSICSSM